MPLRFRRNIRSWKRFQKRLIRRDFTVTVEPYTVEQDPSSPEGYSRIAGTFLMQYVVIEATATSRYYTSVLRHEVTVGWHNGIRSTDLGYAKDARRTTVRLTLTSENIIELLMRLKPGIDATILLNGEPINPVASSEITRHARKNAISGVPLPLEYYSLVNAA